MSTLRISVVQYLNSVPLIWGMLHGRQQGKHELQFATPANCADAVRDGKADVGIIPAIEYHRIENLQIIAGISIASKSRVRSVLLLSKVPIERIQSVAVDTSSRTSAAFLRILMCKFYSRAVELIPSAPRPEEMLKRADSALVIGDPALTYRGSATVYDLAVEWKKFTGLPFVFAFWAGQRDTDLAKRRKDFEQSREFGLAHVDDIAAEYALKLNMDPADVKVYLTENIDYSLDEENLRGLRLFFNLAREAGIIPVEKELRFV
ncbi:MAG: menaquinone biosynthetic enzyme MqnA/MqnD family protein [Terriglobia bacterium]